VDALHGDMSQSAREATMLAFRQRHVKILVGTDVASRGLDVKDISHVINYSLPRELDNYVHRIGRTARSGKTGIAMSLVTPSHRYLIQQIERKTKSRVTEGTIPTRKTIGAKKISQLVGPFADVSVHARAMELMDESWKQAVSNMTGEEVAARFLTLMFPWVFSEKQPQMLKVHTAVTPGTSMPDHAPKKEREDRRPKRDFKKRFTKGFQRGRKNSGRNIRPQI
jgi:ATP-dependent RNA helicase DeaD